MQTKSNCKYIKLVIPNSKPAFHVFPKCMIYINLSITLVHSMLFSQFILKCHACCFLLKFESDSLGIQCYCHQISIQVFSSSFVMFVSGQMHRFKHYILALATLLHILHEFETFVLWFVTFECVSVFSPLYNQNQMGEFCNKTLNFNVLAFYLTHHLCLYKHLFTMRHMCK